MVELIDVFNSEDHGFIAVEAVYGRNLREELKRRGRTGEPRARGLFQQLMMAVEYLHSSSVAHRDIKLENVLLARDGVQIRLASSAWPPGWTSGRATDVMAGLRAYYHGGRPRGAANRGSSATAAPPPTPRPK
ncbi:unnamed protein product [Ectocarpus sp. 4 AP-2014]